MLNKIRLLNANNGFFSRMLLFSTALLTAFSILASVIIGSLSNQYEMTQFVRNYDLAMANLSEALYNRMASFNTLAAKLITGNQCDPDLCALLQYSSYDEVPALVRSNVISLLTAISRDDRYLRGFIIYSAERELLYYYTDARSYLYAAEALPDMPALSPFKGSLVDNASIHLMLDACTNESLSHQRYYGFAATIYKTPSEPLGYLIPLYSTAEFEDILSNFSLDSSSIFHIGDKSGYTFFDSYSFDNDGKKVRFSNAMVNPLYGFQVSYEIYHYNLPQSTITYLIVIFAVLVTLFSFGLYYWTYYLSTRNINAILNGMRLFNLKNLAYRLPVPAERNEFTQITEGFNAMCENLQYNVERSYVYELQQKKSELYALQTSINPHFLYNTLEMIRNQNMNSRTNEASQMILLLSKIYRSQTNTNMFVTLEDEVELCENLMILYQYRFQNFDYEFRIEDQVQRFGLPKNTLQPLIENYFVHGIVAKRQDNVLNLSISLLPGQDVKYIHLSLSNNGNPITPNRLTDITDKLRQNIYVSREADGFALTNVFNRLRIAFQEDCTMAVSSGTDEMTFRIDITFPATALEHLKTSFQ